MRWPLGCCLLSLSAAAFADPIVIVPPEPLLAEVTPVAADPDLQFVGEYWGFLYVQENGQWKRAEVGLQLAARGDGAFEATEYLNGLPGMGWKDGDMAVLPAARTGDVVNVTAEPIGLQVDGQFATVGEYGKGPVYGFLRKIHRESPTLGKAPPKAATVLFDGTNTDAFKDAQMTEDGLLMQGAEMKEPVSDFTLHVEFRLPHMAEARDQGRANSGVYIQRRYEVQILDSFGELPAFNTAGSLYRTKPADLNMSFPPMTWQTYDIRFKAAEFENGVKVNPSTITVWHNGVKVQDQYEIPNKTGAGKPEGPEPLPILFQDHKNPVRFRNIWMVDHTVHPKVDATPKIPSGNPFFAGK